MEKIRHFIDAGVTGCGCNLECSYCYLRQSNYEQKNRPSVLGYSLETIKKACSVERLGGKCLFAVVGDGETLLPEEVVDLILVLVGGGHFVTVLTNGTITKRLHELVERLEDIGKKDAVCIHFSLHYLELKKKGLLEVFFNNVKYISENNMSFHLKSILGEEFDEDLAEELKEISLKEVGAFPQIGIARKDNPDGSFSICTNLSNEDYFKIGDSFQSQLFELDKREFNNKRRGFCYAGEWVFDLNFTTGLCWQCLSNDFNTFNFFENINEKPPLEAVGTYCNREYCSCVNLQAWGIMPDHEEYTNLDIYNRPEAGWIKEPFLSIMNQKLSVTNEIYSEKEKAKLAKRRKRKQIIRKMKLSKCGQMLWKLKMGVGQIVYRGKQKTN